MTFDQLYNLVLEQSNPVQPVNLPSPQEKAQKQQAFQQQQQKSVQDVKSLGSGVLEVAKFLDPTGILSWDDVKKAQEAFKKDPSGTNGLMYMLAIGSVIPAVGKGPKMLKTAIRGGEEAAIRSSLNTFVRDFNPDQLAVIRQYIDSGLDPNQARMAYDAVLRDQQRLVNELQSIYRRENIPQRLPNLARGFRGNISERWNYGTIRITDVYDMLKNYVKNVKALFGNQIFKLEDLSSERLKVLDFQVIPGRDGQHRQFIELGWKKNPNDKEYQKFLMYSSSGKSTPGKKEFGDWNTTAAYVTTNDRVDDYNRPIWSGMWMKDQPTLDLTKGDSPYLTGLARYLETYGPATLTGDYF
jgi:hypothetical protein